MKILKSSAILLLMAGFSLPFFQACEETVQFQSEQPTVASFDHSVILRWNQVFLELDRYAAGYRPGPAAHALAYLGFSAYEAVVPGIAGNKSLANLYPGLEIPVFDEDLEYHWPAVINESYAYLMHRFFFHMEATHPELYQQIEQVRLELRTQYAQETTPEILVRSEIRGQQVATAIYEWEETDLAAHNAFLNPQPPFNGPHGPGYWEPTFPDFTSAMHPFWGQVRTFALSEAEQHAQPPFAYSEDPSSVFHTQAVEVFAHVQNIKEHGSNSFNDLWVAEFWSDDITGLTFSTPSRFIGIADQVVAKENTNLAQAVELYAKISMALSDVGVAVWQSKSVYKIERPVSYIRRVIGLEIPEAEQFTPVLNDLVSGTQGITPPSPGYPSGHAGFSGASGIILSSFFEYTDENPGLYAFTDRCHQDRPEFEGAPRSFSSFSNMAEEVAYSRILLGVNFRMDCDEGLRLGELAAQRVLELPWKN